MDKKIISKIYGGLGNQMFQYALGKKLSLQYNCPLQLDLTWFDEYAPVKHPRPFLLDIFPINVVKTSEAELAQFKITKEHVLSKVLRKLCGKKRIFPQYYIYEPHYAYWNDIEKISAPAFVDGYWQSEEYFSDAKQQIRENFIFPVLPVHSQSMAKKILQSSNAVSVHIRRGDYISNPQALKTHGICNSTYYARCFAYLKECIDSEFEIFLFSDEPAWCREHFNAQGHTITVVDLHTEEQGYHDMHLMSLCPHHIIANSSFSWWGAWLGEQSHSIICAPTVWFASDPQKGNPCPNRWTRIQG